MTSLKVFFDLLKNEMMKRGVSEIPNPEKLAYEASEFCFNRLNERQSNENHVNEYVPILSYDGIIIEPNQIDYLSESLDVDSGLHISFILRS